MNAVNALSGFVKTSPIQAGCLAVLAAKIGYVAYNKLSDMYNNTDWAGKKDEVIDFVSPAAPSPLWYKLEEAV